MVYNSDHCIPSVCKKYLACTSAVQFLYYLVLYYYVDKSKQRKNSSNDYLFYVILVPSILGLILGILVGLVVISMEKVPTECENVLSLYSMYLSEIYSKQKSIDDKLNLVAFEYYIPLVIVKRQKVNKAEADELTRMTLHGGPDDIMQVKEKLELQDLFKPVSGDTIKFLLIHGAPGIGKSTLALHIARNWQLLTNYSIAILVRLRESTSQSAEQIDDLYIKKTSSDMNKIQNCIDEANGEGVLWILDGFDELPFAQQRDTESVYHQLLRGKILPSSTVVITSRHSATTKLKQYLDFVGSKHVEIVGFSREQIDDYVSLAFENESQDMLSNFTEYYSKNPVIKSLMYVPLNTAIISFVFRTHFDSSKLFPHTMTGLYSRLVCILMRRHKSQPLHDHRIPDSLVTEEDIRKLPEKEQESFRKLTELAYQGIVSGKYIFSEDNLDHLGLMNNVSSLSGSGGTDCSYNFFHMTLQEYLAALYVSQFSYLVETVTHKEVVVTFFFGISSEMKNRNHSALDFAYTNHYRWYLRLLYEFPEYKKPHSLVSFHHGVDDVRPSDFYIAGYLISQFALSIECVILAYNNFEEVEMLVSGLNSEDSAASLLRFGKIGELLIECTAMEKSTSCVASSSSSNTLSKLLHSSKFMKGSISISLHDSSCLVLTHFVPANAFTRLKVNIAFYIDQSTDDSKELIKHVANNALVTDVVLKHNVPDLQAISQFVSSSSIRSVHLSAQNLNDEFDTVSEFFSNSNLQQLILEDCQVSVELLHTILSGKDLTHLEITSIEENYDSILDTLFCSSSLHYLGIPISAEAVQYDFVGLQNNKNIQSLKLLLNTCELVSTLAEAITSKNNSLIHLDVVIETAADIDECLNFLSLIVVQSTAPLSVLSIQLNTFVLDDFFEFSSESLVKLVESAMQKPTENTFQLQLGPYLYQKIPDQMEYLNKIVIKESSPCHNSNDEI